MNSKTHFKQWLEVDSAGKKEEMSSIFKSNFSIESCEDISEQETMFKLVKHVFEKALPLLIASLGNAFSLTITMIFVAHHTTDRYIYGAIGKLSAEHYKRCGAIDTGFNNSLITYLSNAYGARQNEYMKVLMSRAKIFYTILIIPFLVLLVFTKEILLLFGQNNELATNTGNYVFIVMFGFVAHLHYDIYRKFLNCMKMFCIHSPVTIISLSLHVFWCYTLIVHFKLELFGAAFAIFIQSCTNFVLIFSIVKFFGYGKKYDSTCNSKAFNQWGEVFKDGFPTYILQLMSFFTIESALLISGYLELEILIANTALVNLMNILYLLVYGVKSKKIT